MAKAAAVANEFLALAAKDPAYRFIDQMKLQKLVFYAQAWHLALKGTELFGEDIHAWEWGPVVPEIYYQTRKYGRQNVEQPILSMNADGKWEAPQVKDESERELIQNVWDAHKRLSGIQLSNATHATGEPWTIVRDGLGGDLSSKPRISPEIIEAVFKKKLRLLN